MSEQAKNALLGVFILSAFAVVVFIFLFLHPSLGDKGQLIRVRFTDIDKINVGTRVTFAGKSIGEVDKIIELEDIRQGRTEYKGDVYVYELVLLVDSGLKIYNTDSISARTSGLLGEKSISIDPQPPKPGQELRIVNKEILYAGQVGSVEDTFKEFKEVADKFDVALDSFTDTLHEIREKKIWDNIATTVENLSEISTKFNESWPEVDTAIANFSATSVNIKEISDNVREGKGTIGRLISKDDMYLRATSLLSKGETVMDDVNHYGIFFHHDKRWQRLRARRMNLMQKLSSPQEFRNYFNDEIDQVSTSLSRVSMLLDKTSEFPMCPFIMDNNEFHKVFAELLRRVETLQESLKMYNTQLMECEVQQTELVAE